MYIYNLIFFLAPWILFSLIYRFFPFTHTVTQTKATISQKGCCGERGAPERLGSREQVMATIAALGDAYSHHGELPAELCPTLWGCFSFCCKCCRKVKMTDRPCLTFLCLWNQCVLWETWDFKPPMCFLKHQELVKELVSETLKDSYFCFD